MTSSLHTKSAQILFALLTGCLFLALSGNVHASTYYSDYGQNRTHNITIQIGIHNFQVNGIATYKNTEWYVDGVYTGEGENDWSDWWAKDPEYTRSFSSGTTEIKAIVYDRYWNLEEYHIWNVTVAQPDLIAYGISVSDNTVDPSQGITVYWTAKNQGDASCGSSYQGVMWSTNSTITTSDTLLASEYLGSMDARETDPESNHITIPSNANPGQTYYIGIIADYDNDVPNESSESNNNDGTPVTITINQPPKPDLIVQDISISPSSPQAGESITITATLKNQGDADADAFDLKYYVDGSHIGDDRCSWGLGVGDSDDESISYTVSDSGNHTIKVFVDSGYEIDEGDNENNNTREETYYWSIPTGSLIVRMYNVGGAC